MQRSGPFSVRDLLYLDFDKAASIWSQFEEGLLERISETEDIGKDRTAGTKFGIPKVAEANLGVEYQNKRSTLRSKTLHHDVLNRVENRLAELGLVADLSREIEKGESTPEKIRTTIGNRPYIRAEGASVLEDYRRILSISEKFNEIIEFLAKVGQERVKKSDEYLQVQALLEAAKKSSQSVPDRNQRVLQRAKVEEAKRRLEELSKPQLAKLDQWLVDGIRLFINTFMPSRINFRIYPFADCPSFQVLCNLKRECFVDSDPEHLLYGYGNRPSVPLAVFGLITSLPNQARSEFDPMKEFEDPDLSEREAFEKGFRGVFGGMEGMESLVRYSRYPNVTVHPIAVYRSFQTPSNRQ